MSDSISTVLFLECLDLYSYRVEMDKYKITVTTNPGLNEKQKEMFSRLVIGPYEIEFVTGEL